MTHVSPDFQDQLNSKPIRKVLAFAHPSLGDAIMLTAPLRWLKETFPEVEITVIGTPLNAPIFQNCGLVDKIEMRPKGWATKIRTPSIYKQNFDLFINFYDHNQSNRWAKSAQIPLRIGIETEKCKTLSSYHAYASPETDQLIVPGGTGNLLKLIGCDVSDWHPTFQIPDLNLKLADKFLLENEIEGRFVVVHPGASNSVKQWPFEKFLATIDALQKLRIPCVLIGGNDVAMMLASKPNAGDRKIVCAAGKTDLLTSCALIQKAELLICNDSGPMHVAGAVGTKVVAIVGAHYGRVRPWGEGHQLFHSECSCPIKEYEFCTSRCMSEVEESVVTAAALQSLSMNSELTV